MAPDGACVDGDEARAYKVRPPPSPDRARRPWGPARLSAGAEGWAARCARLRARPERHAVHDGIRTPARTVRAPGAPLAARSGHRSPGFDGVDTSAFRCLPG